MTLPWADPGLPGGDLWPRAAGWGSQASQTQARGAHPQVAGEAMPTPRRRPQPRPRAGKPQGGKQVGVEDPGRHQPRWLQSGRKSGCKTVPCPPQMECAGRWGHRPGCRGRGRRGAVSAVLPTAVRPAGLAAPPPYLSPGSAPVPLCGGLHNPARPISPHPPLPPDCSHLCSPGREGCPWSTTPAVSQG